MCTKYTTENVCNEIDVQKDFNGHTCRSSSFYVHRELCGCVKVTEFDRETNVLTVYHQGTHTCDPKPNVEEHINKAKEENMENVPLSIALRNTLNEFQTDLIGYYIATGKFARQRNLQFI